MQRCCQKQSTKTYQVSPSKISKKKYRIFFRVEMALKDALQEIQTLERTIAGMKKEKQQLEANNDILRTEKKRMQDMLSDTVKEKFEVVEQMNSMKKIGIYFLSEIN